MKTSKSIAVIAAGTILCALCLLVGCTQEQGGKRPPGSGTESDAIHPVPFPSNLGITGFHFPEDSNRVYSWLHKNDTLSIYEHAWGIWTGLTSSSDQQYKEQELLVYETWLGIADLQSLVEAGNKNGGCTGVKIGRTPLSRPNQFLHAVQARQQALLSTPIDTTTEFWVSVAYDPNAACYATKHLIFQQSVLNGYLKPNGIGAIPPFPNNAITTKPTYFVGKVSDTLIEIPVWPGPPSPPQALPSSKFNLFVYADVNNKRPAGKKITPARGPDPSPAEILAATVNLNDFIYFKIDAAAAAYINEQQSTQGITAEAGDLAILVAMHVATKEISNWTWQTFFWAPDPDNPAWPSSAAAANRRPGQLKGAPAHYAVSTAYAMVMPNQPITGGSNKNVTPVIGYNPYLEASFGPDVFKFPNALNPNYEYGIETNCMSCHALAVYDPVSPDTEIYSTDQYIDMKDSSYFNGKVQLDFAWSIQSTIIKTKHK